MYIVFILYNVFLFSKQITVMTKLRMKCHGSGTLPTTSISM
jgi:hypothetical protein